MPIASTASIHAHSVQSTPMAGRPDQQVVLER
jgi:hypothetical protein